jgi:hypothetical protein
MKIGIKWINENSPRAFEEWEPPLGKSFFEPIAEPKAGEESRETKFEKFKKSILERAGPWIRDDYVRSAREKEKERGKEIIIIDPLAYYIPYHHDDENWGIYFRVDKIILDFKDFITFISRISRIITIDIEDAWSIYIMVIFWHELTHHVLEDIITVIETIRRGRLYPIFKRDEEERFSEYTAFSTAYEYIYIPIPIGYTIPLLDPEYLVHVRGVGEKEILLSALYYHWGRDDPASPYHPVVEQAIPRIVDGLWKTFWEAHSRLGELGMADRMGSRIYCTTL